MRARHLQHGARLGQLPPLRGGQVRGDGLAELLALRPGPAREPAARRDHRLRRLRPRQLLAAGPLLRDVPRGLVRARPRDVPAVRAGHVQRRRRRDGVRQVPERPLPVRARAAALRGLRGGPRRRADGGQPAERPVRRLRRGQGQRRRRARLPRVRGRPEPARVGPRGVRGVRGGALRAEPRPDLLRELPHRGRRALERAGRRGLRRVRARLLLRQPDVPRLPLVGDVPAGLDARQPLGRARGLLPLLDGHAGHLPLQAQRGLRQRQLERQRALRQAPPRAALPALRRRLLPRARPAPVQAVRRPAVGLPAGRLRRRHARRPGARRRGRVVRGGVARGALRLPLAGGPLVRGLARGPRLARGEARGLELPDEHVRARDLALARGPRALLERRGRRLPGRAGRVATDLPHGTRNTHASMAAQARSSGSCASTRS